MYWFGLQQMKWNRFRFFAIVKKWITENKYLKYSQNIHTSIFYTWYFFKNILNIFECLLILIAFVYDLCW